LRAESASSSAAATTAMHFRNGAIAFAFRRPLQFAPGKNLSYSHTNFMILGRVLSIIGKKPLAVVLRNKAQSARC
jgi:CubicO group peptidase (beta-lactamase class C family)